MWSFVLFCFWHPKDVIAILSKYKKVFCGIFKSIFLRGYEVIDYGVEKKILTLKRYMTY